MPSTNGHGTHETMERVALYLRVSSEEQKTKETIATQDAFLDEYCKLYHHEIAGVYKDAAISGTVPMAERPAGRELLEDAGEGKFDVVLVYKLDRIGRALLVVVDAHDRLQEVGVALRSANEPIDTSSASGRLIFQMLGSFAEFEKATINERTRDGKNRAYRGGAQPGVIPYGYDIAQDGSFVVVEEEGQVVRAIIRNIAHGATLFTEAKRLNLEGVPSPGKKYRSRPRHHGTTWSPMAISRIVGRRAYSGTHVIHSSAGEIEREVPSVVPGELQERAIARLRDNKRYSGGQPVRKYLLRGLIRCEACDWNYSGISRKREGHYHFKYACPASSSRRFDPHAQRNRCPWLDALWLEGLVWQDIRTFVENPGDVLERVKEQMEEQQGQADEIEQRRASLAKRLAAAQGEKDKFVRLYAAGHLDDQELETHLLDLKNRISNLKLLIEASEAHLAREEQNATVAKSTAAWLASLRERIEELEEDSEEAWQDRRELVEHLVERIAVGRAQDGRAKVKITYKFAPPAQAASGVTDNKTFEILAGEIPIPEALGRL
jgi:site-specific DNA recombinase